MLQHLRCQRYLQHIKPKISSRNSSSSTPTPKSSSSSSMMLIGASVGFGIFIPCCIAYGLETNNPMFKRFDYPIFDSHRRALRSLKVVQPTIVPTSPDSVETNVNNNISSFAEIVSIEDDSDGKPETSNLKIGSVNEEVVPVAENVEQSTAEISSSEKSTAAEEVIFSSSSQSAPSPSVDETKHEMDTPNTTRVDLPPPSSPFADLSRSMPIKDEIFALEDTSTMNEDALRRRVSQLTAELVDRTRWEGIRLQHMLMQSEAEMEKRFLAVLDKERLEAEMEKQSTLQATENALREANAKELAASKGEMEQRMQDTLRAQAEGFSKSLKQELHEQEERLNKDAEIALSMQVAVVREAQLRAMIPQLADVEIARAELAVFKSAVDDIQTSRVDAQAAHKLSAAALLFGETLAASKPVGKEVSMIQKVTTANDEVVSLALTSLPSQVLTDGAPSREELSAHFAVLRPEIRKVALAPAAAPATLANVVGGLLAAVSWAPSGYVSGDGVEEVLSRVAFLVDFGDLKGALREIDGLQGKPRELAKTWEQSVRSRLEAEQAYKIVKASAALRHIQLAK